MDPVARSRQKDIKAAYRRELLELCYYYPQFTLGEAQDLPQGEADAMLAFARLREVEHLSDLLTVFAAAQSEKGYKKLRGQLADTAKQLRAAL